MTMRATFRITDPNSTPLTLSLTATMAEWREIMAELPDDNTRPSQFRKMIAGMITKAGGVVVGETWTTGYSQGEVDG